MIDAPTRDATMVVVDRDRAGYELLAPLAAGEGVTSRFLSTGREALRLARAESVALWLIGVDLPDMSGFDLRPECISSLRSGRTPAAERR